MAAVTTKRKTSIAKEPVTPERIAARAYELFLQRGATDGDDVQDWLAAERELLAAVAPKRRAVKAVVAMATESLSTAEKVIPKKTTKKATTAKTTASATTTTRRKTKTSSANDKKKK